MIDKAQRVVNAVSTVVDGDTRREPPRSDGSLRGPMRGVLLTVSTVGVLALLLFAIRFGSTWTYGGNASWPVTFAFVGYAIGMLGILKMFRTARRERRPRANARRDDLPAAQTTGAVIPARDSQLAPDVPGRDETSAELRAIETHFRALVETSGDIVWAVDETGCYTYVNGAALEAVLGYRAEEVIGYPFAQFADQHSAQSFDEEFFKLSEVGAGQLEMKGIFLHRDGRRVHLAVSAIALHDEEGCFVGASGTAVDVSEIKVAESLLRQALAEQRAILDSATVGIAIIEEGVIVRANSEWESMLRYAQGCSDGLPVSSLCRADDVEEWPEAIDSAVASRGAYDRDIVCVRCDGTTFWCRLTVRPFEREGSRDATIWVLQDISDRKQKEQAIEHAALHDSLTGLPNRALLSDRLEQAIRQASRASTRFGVLFLDLDRFKMVNDTIGHDGGDELLRAVADRLRRRLRSTDTVARQGGDEFIVMLPSVTSMNDVERIAEQLLAEIAAPINVFGNDYVVTGSIGISLYPDHGNDGQTLLRNADAAMYRAKDRGKNTWHVFSEDLHLQAAEDVKLENLLRAAIDMQQLTVYYQPRIDLATGRISSLEALCRWQHASLGPVEPTRFIAIAERAGLIGRLGDWVLRKACEDLSLLTELGFDVGLSVNVSHSQLTDGKLVAKVSRTLREFGIAPDRLELELTETAIARNVEQAVRIMQSLEATGIGVAIDDFGTGYSSLSQLKRFPVRTLKIDRSFIDQLPGEENDVAIALAIIAMAKRLKMRVVAEGVERSEQRDFLRVHECDQAQGFLFSAPVPLAKIIEILRPGALPPLRLARRVA